MQKNYDLVVIGSGMGAGPVHEYKKAYPEASVALIDNRPLGGTCPLRGCLPKKMMFDRFSTRYQAQRLIGKGIDGEISINWSTMISQVHDFVEGVPDSMRRGYENAGIDLFEGHASFVSSHEIQVGDSRLTAKNIVICTGSRPRELNIEGAEHAIVSDGLFTLSSLPRDMVFIGAGYISLEFAHMVAMAGTRVTVLQKGERLLPMFDKELVQQLISSASEHGIDIRFNEDVTSIEKQGDAFIVNTNKNSFKTGLVLNGTGRVPYLDGLDLDNAGVHIEYNQRQEPRGIPVKETMQTNIPHIYAIGDVVPSSPQLTPVGGIESDVVSHNLIHGNVTSIDYGVIPSIAFLEPQIAGVGLKEQDLQDPSRYRILPAEGRFAGDFTDMSRNLGHAAKKFIVDEHGLLVGAHLMGYGVEDLINMYAVIIDNKLKVDSLWLPYGFPTRSYDQMKLLTGGKR